MNNPEMNQKLSGKLFCHYFEEHWIECFQWCRRKWFVLTSQILYDQLFCWTGTRLWCSLASSSIDAISSQINGGKIRPFRLYCVCHLMLPFTGRGIKMSWRPGTYGGGWWWWLSKYKCETNDCSKTRLHSSTLLAQDIQLSGGPSATISPHKPNIRISFSDNEKHLESDGWDPINTLTFHE